MSGRAKHAPAGASSHDELRALTRVLHEAAQDARDAEKRLRAAYAECRDDIRDQLAAEYRDGLDKHWDELTANLIEQLGSLNGKLTEVEAAVRDRFAVYLGAEDAQDLIRRLADEIARSSRAHAAQAAGLVKFPGMPV